MIDALRAKQYANVLNPALAGYYHDGIVSDSDALAAVMHLIKQGYLAPEFKDNNITHGLAYLRKTAKASPLPFEQAIIKAIFYDKDRVSTQEVGTMIKSGIIQAGIMTAIDLKTYPFIGSIDRATQKVDIVTIDRGPNRVIGLFPKAKISLSLLIASTFLMTIYAVIKSDYQDMLMNACMAIIIGIIYNVLALDKKKTQSAATILPYNQYYSDLHGFLDKHPPQPHTFTYEYLPYAIAFGIDKSWQADFGLAVTDYVVDKGAYSTG